MGIWIRSQDKKSLLLCKSFDVGCDNYKHSVCGCYFPSFKKEMIKKIDKHFEVLDVIKEEVDEVIDLLDVLAMGHIDIAIKKLEIIQDKLMGMEEDA